jgi:RNA polymerase sigma factor (sigma-70 family)
VSDGVVGDADLIARVLGSDDRPAFGELVRRHQSSVRRLLRRLCCGDSSNADDLAQVTFLRAYDHLSEYRGSAPLSAWLVGIAYRAFLSEARRLKADTRLEAPPDGAWNGPATLLHHDLEKALAVVPIDERVALVLTYARDLSHEEAAELLGCPLGTLKARVARAKERLRPLLQGWKNAEVS